MAEATVYTCPQCGATLKLDPSTGKLFCEFCEGSYDVEEFEKKVDETSPRQKAKKGEDPTGGVKFAYRTIGEWEQLLATSTYEKLEDVVGYTCHNCGAQVVTDALTVATSCQYCGSSVVVDQRLSGSIKPSFVIPFKVKAEELADRLTEFYKNRPLLPKNFFRESQVGTVQGLYVPFWFYSGTVEGEGVYQISKSTHWTEGDYDVTQTTKFESYRKGDVTFANVPVDASVRIDDDLMDSIEPFNYAELKPFQPGYLTGFVAERFDQSPRQVFERAGLRMKNSASGTFVSSLPAHDTITGRGEHFDFNNPTASYAMLPVYLFNCKYGGKLYRFAVNGQTGKIVGEVPSGKRESLLAWLRGFATGVGGAIVIAIILAIIWWLNS